MKPIVKRALALAVALLLALPVFALAETVYYGDMTVEHCEEWVSLRDVPGTGGKRLAKVPLHATVTDAQWDRFCGDFLYCCYQGQYGYILAQYLEPAQTGESDVVMDVRLGETRIVAERSYVNGGEHIKVTCTDGQGDMRWYHETGTTDVTELVLTTAFLAGTAREPMVMVYNAETGLTALSADGGETLWQLEDVALGASNSWATGSDGTVYIGGYYGPDPVAIDYLGHVIWQAESSDSYWLYHMELSESEGKLTCWYDVMDGGERSGRVVYDLDGMVLQKYYD